MRLIKRLEDLERNIKTYRKRPILVKAVQLAEEVWIETREGRLRGYPGDFIIQGIEGEIYPCNEGIFYQTYETFPCPYCNETRRVPEGIAVEPYWFNEPGAMDGDKWAKTKWTTCPYCRSEKP